MKKYVLTLAYSRPQCNEFELEFKYSNSIKELQKEVRNYIGENVIMGSEWEGGQVYNPETKELVGIIAYNGKFYDKDEAKKLGLK